MICNHTGDDRNALPDATIVAFGAISIERARDQRESICDRLEHCANDLDRLGLLSQPKDSAACISRPAGASFA